MIKNHHKDQVGDIKSPALRPREDALRGAADQAILIDADVSTLAVKSNPLETLSSSVSRSGLTKYNTCAQVLWISFFFDGTGNNMDADEGWLKLSNVAKLFRVHKKIDINRGVYSVYVPGVGTYFPAIGDDGGSALGLGCGAMGQARLDHALGEFDKSLKRHIANAKAPSNAIHEINIAVFGFSRGAALARAFVNQLLLSRCSVRAGKWSLTQGGWAVRVRFMGLFDTVASVGLPMSSNTTSVVGTVASSVRYMIANRLRDFRKTRPEVLAFAKNAVPGADPAPGAYDGHKDWGGQLEIPEMVEEVRHFVAAHEIRNSFPLDSVSNHRRGRVTKHGHFYETIYPGVHSDIGGSYAPGEGARGDTLKENLGLIPLMHMYKFAVRCGVPLLPEDAWETRNKDDFEVDPDLLRLYNHYVQKIGVCSGSMGEIVAKHMELFFAWRFRAIGLKAKGDNTESRRIALHNNHFKQQAALLQAELATLTRNDESAVHELNFAVARRNVAAVSDARVKQSAVREEFMTVQSRKDALPNMEELQAMLEMYDRQLLSDVRAIKREFSQKDILTWKSVEGKRSELRPHYKMLVTAYENEFEKNNGLRDKSVIEFFDSYVHDSLAGFAKDATLPSDPRVIYLGGDEKYKYAKLRSSEERSRVTAVS